MGCGVGVLVPFIMDKIAGDGMLYELDYAEKMIEFNKTLHKQGNIDFIVADAAELSDDLSLIDSGIVDSTGMLDVILFLEDRYGIHVEDHETTPANLETIGRIGAYVTRKRTQATSAA